MKKHGPSYSEVSELKQMAPLARRDSLIVKELPDETLVYDLTARQAHCLNLTAARVWKNCDGTRTVAQLRQLIQIETGSVVAQEIIWLALDQLKKFNLLEITPVTPQFLAQMNRRELARSIGIGAILLPIIVTIMVPTALAQGSGCKQDPCTFPSQCCPAHDNCKNGKCK